MWKEEGLNDNQYIYLESEKGRGLKKHSKKSHLSIDLNHRENTNVILRIMFYREQRGATEKRDGEGDNEMVELLGKLKP